MAAPAAPAPVPSQKHLTNDYETPLTVENAEEEMIRVLNKLVHNIPPEKLSRDGPEPNGGLLMGPTGLAYVRTRRSRYASTIARLTAPYSCSFTYRNLTHR